MKQSEIRHQMKQEFQYGLDQKILSYNIEIGIQCFESALKLANQLSHPSFWPKLIKYRLAHLLLRNVDDVNSIKKAIVLLADDSVTEFVHLDFVSRMLKITCLHRLTCLTGVDNTSKINSTFNSLLFLMRNHGLNSKTNSVEQYPLQSYHYNLIEMAMYFTGAEISDDALLPEGSKVMHNVKGQKSWSIFLPNGEPDGLKYERQMALDEVMTLMQDTENASLLIIGEYDDFEFTYRGQIVNDLNPKHLNFVANFIKHKGYMQKKDINHSPSSIGRYKDKINQALNVDLISYVDSRHHYELSQTEKIFLIEFT